MSHTGTIGAYLSAARPQALAALVRYFRDVDLAEDSFQEACLRAIRRWPEAGLPRNPTAWLVLVGRNAGIDLRRRSRSGQSVELDDELPATDPDVEDRAIADIDMSDYRDDVLRLLFMCCHPDLTVQDQLALALKVVVGFTVAEVARALVVSPKAMEQRITRAKRRVAAVATTLETPSLAERTERLAAVSAMIYLLFNEGYSAGGGAIHIRLALCEEAIRLARLLLTLFPSQAEVMGLLALCLLQHSRHRARLGEDGGLVPLDDQDRALWDGEMIAEGRVLIEKALRRGAPGPYQIQAAITAVHCVAATPEATDWREIERLYVALEALQPSPIVTLNRAAAVSKARGAAEALAMTGPLADALSGYLHYHTTRAALHRDLGNHAAARAAYEAALALNPTSAEVAYIDARLSELREISSAESD